MMNQPRWKLRIDTGGTFTDCIGHAPDGSVHRRKVLSSGALRGRISHLRSGRALTIKQSWQAPGDFVRGFTLRLPAAPEAGLFTAQRFDPDDSLLELGREMPAKYEGATFEIETGLEAPVLGAMLLTGTRPGEPLPPADLRLATTRGTNALLERRGGRTLLLVTEGFADLGTIGDQTRPELFALRIDRPAPLSEWVVEVPERIDFRGDVVRPFDEEELKRRLEQLPERPDAVAVCLMNSYRNPAHEERAGRLLKALAFPDPSLSSRLAPSAGFLTRLRTTEVNAYLTPPMKSYLKAIRNQASLDRFSVMTSSGSLSHDDLYRPKDGLLSGPAGGVAGAAVSGRIAGRDRIIAFDMGGTSTDVSRYDGCYDYRTEQTVGGVTLTSPALAIETVAAGGGSICAFDGKSLTVGPESAGAEPGPACYGAGGPLTITDINLLSGRLDPANFQLPVDRSAARKRFDELLREMEAAGSGLPEPEVLEGFLEIANEKMAQAVSRISTAAGFNPSDYTMVSFGGAGGQHATAVASRLGIRRILLPPDSGLLSAFGLDYARLERILTEPVLAPLESIRPKLEASLDALTREAETMLRNEGVSGKEIEISERTLMARLTGQESTLELPWMGGLELERRFENLYRELYGHWIPERPIEIESLRVRVSQREKPINPSERVVRTGRAVPSEKRPFFRAGRPSMLDVCHRRQLGPGDSIRGPALVLDPWSTLYLEPGWHASVRSDLTLELEASQIGESPLSRLAAGNNGSGRNRFGPTGKPGPFEAEGRTGRAAVDLQLYTNRFRSIAHQMGEMLRRTSLSVNVKERLDFSCALLDSEGFLVVNAPHIPVHLGAMGHCVRALIREIPMEEGDLVITNHPGFGGSHLPDITAVSPVFSNGKRIAFVASRAHHAEIGGKSPGSMPPDAKNLAEEGVVIPPFRLVRAGEADWNGLRKLLEGGEWPSRSPDENIADLQAAVAANHFGAKKLLELTSEFGADEVTDYMEQLRSYAAARMRATLKRLKPGTRAAMERLDDGSLLSVRCTIRDGELEIDFSGTAQVHPGNLNANPSIVNSVVIYLLRLLVQEPLPLNDGLLEPVTIRLPRSLLNPAYPADPRRCPAVVGGNIEVSQRLTDTLLKAFRLCGCSQGTMNNLLFGNERFGYYETVAGDTGAGDGFDGCSGVHHHMTNTRATDPEILELRYPVRLERFALRRGSGGRGRWRGGDGVIREFLFLEPLELSLLTQHRVVAPYGLKGGEPGSCGDQLLIRESGEKQRLLWQDAASVKPGDRLILTTPGGGGYGEAEQTDNRTTPLPF